MRKKKRDTKIQILNNYLQNNFINVINFGKLKLDPIRYLRLINQVVIVLF